MSFLNPATFDGDIQDGKVDLVQAASVSVHGSHGQHIENIHLEQYTSEAQFWDMLYPKKYSRLLKKAAEFIEGSGGPGDDVLVFIRLVASYHFISADLGQSLKKLQRRV